jgi:hypothetical protein
MTTLDRIEIAGLARGADVALRCIVFHRGFDFDAGEPALIRVLTTTSAAGWALVRSRPHELAPLQSWALVEHADGTRHVEGVVRDPEWADDPGGAQFTDEHGCYVLGSMAAWAPQQP